MKWLKGRGEFLTLLGLHVGLFISVKTDMSALKADISALRAEVREEITALRAEFKADINRLDSDIKELRTLLINHLTMVKI